MGTVDVVNAADVIPVDGEVVVVMPIPEGVDRQTWRILGYAAMAGVSFIPGWGPVAAFVGSNLINLFIKDKSPNDMAMSQSYSWQYVNSPTAAHGAAMPVIYGKTRIRPVLKNRYVTVEGDKQRLYALYGIAGHKVDVRTLPEYAAGSGDYEVQWSGQPGMSFINRLRWAASLPIPKVYPLYDGNGDLGKGWTIGHGTASFATDILINGRAITDYGADITWETRPGLPEQSVILGFDVTYSNETLSTELYMDQAIPNRNEAYIRYSSRANRVVWYEHLVRLNGVNYTIQADSKAFAPGVTYYVYFDLALSNRKYYMASGTPPTAATAYIIASFKGRANGISDVTYYPMQALPAVADWISPVATITAAHNIELAFEFTNGLYGVFNGTDLVTATARIFAEYREYGTDEWSAFDFAFSEFDYTETDGATGTVYGAISAKKAEIFYKSLKARSEENPLDYSKTYEIRVTASSPCVVKLVNVATVVYGEENSDGSAPGFTYPGEPLLGIKALASGQISGDLDVQVDVERSLVWVHNGSTWVQKAANNHAWSVYDILANGHPDHPAYPTLGNANAEAPYGCGIDHDRINYTSFEEWADNITTIGYELNIVFDTFMTAWDAILRICQEGRGMVYPIGTVIYAYTDKAADVTQVFTMGNIHVDSFVQKYMAESQKMNMIEVNYYDAEKGYGKTTIAARTADWDTSDAVSNPTTVTLYGTTTFAQAWSIARFLLMGNELLNNVITFGVDVDGLAAQVGDVVEVQHDVLTTGEGGRIVSVEMLPNSHTLITFDRTLTIVPGVTYELKVWHNDNTVETWPSVTGGSSTNSIDFGPYPAWVKTPAQYEPYSFGVAGSHVATYRITDISRTNDLMRTLTLVEYDAGLYDSVTPGTAAPAAGKGQFTSAGLLPSDIVVETVTRLLNMASNVQLREVVSRNRVTGEYESSILATWTSADGDPRGMWEVWFRDVDASDVDWQGTWEMGTTYGEGDKVELDGKVYISLRGDNVSRPFSI